MSSLHFCAAAHSGPLRICEGLSQTRPIFHTLPKRIPEKPGTASGSSPALCHFGCEPSASSIRKDGGPNNALRARVPEERPQGARGLLSTLCVYRPPSGLPHVFTWLLHIRPSRRGSRQEGGWGGEDDKGPSSRWSWFPLRNLLKTPTGHVHERAILRNVATPGVTGTETWSPSPGQTARAGSGSGEEVERLSAGCLVVRWDRGTRLINPDHCVARLSHGTRRRGRRPDTSGGSGVHGPFVRMWPSARPRGVSGRLGKNSVSRVLLRAPLRASRWALGLIFSRPKTLLKQHSVASPQIGPPVAAGTPSSFHPSTDVQVGKWWVGR